MYRERDLITKQMRLARLLGACNACQMHKCRTAMGEMNLQSHNYSHGFLFKMTMVLKYVGSGAT